MAWKNWQTLAAGLCLVMGCSEADPAAEERTPDDVEVDASKPKPGKTDAGKDAGSSPVEADDDEETPIDDADDEPETPPVGPAGDAGKPPTDPEKPGDKPTDPTTTEGKFDYEKQEVKLTEDLVIPAGKTVRVGPGTNFTASKDVKVKVQGTLIVEGTAESPASFLGSGSPRSWYGIVVEKGGSLTLTRAKVGGAAYGLYALPGSDFTVDYTEFNTSFKAAIIESDGSFDHTLFLSTPPPTISLASEVSVDDPNGTLTIMDASPTVKNSRFDGSSALTDMVRIGGESSPTFDHIYVHDAHCGFHTYGGTNTSARITNSLLENLSYGFMAYTTKPIVEDSVFKNNGSDFGICVGATAENAPALKNNHYSSGEVSLDPSCFNINTVDASPAKTANPSVGPVGL